MGLGSEIRKKTYSGSRIWIRNTVSGAWGKMIHEKNLKQKSCDTVPLTLCQSQLYPPVRDFGFGL
jgi:hypothetical protein